MIDDLTVLGPDGIHRSYDEHYDTVMDVEQDPTGAFYAIQKQAERIEELEKELEYWRGDSAAGWDKCEEYRNKLAKAMLALDEAIYLLDPDEEDIAKQTGLHRIVTTYAELKGEK